MQNAEINWTATIWYLERLHFSQERLNPSEQLDSISFMGITLEENRECVQQYMKYIFGLTKLSINNAVQKYNIIRNFLEWLSQNKQSVLHCDSFWINNYFNMLQEKTIIEKTFNGYVISIKQFFEFLVVRGYIDKEPIQFEYYLKKQIIQHHDRSIKQEVPLEIIKKLHFLPEHLRCIYLHLWCLGLRISEVCTLKGNAYYMQNADAWIQVYQVKMKSYKRVPMPKALYQIMQIYIEKNNIAPDEYLFKNKKGGAYQSNTFRQQMIRFCREYQIENGEYVFRTHDYRHTLATYLFDTGVSLQSIRDLLGHKNDEMTQQYIDYLSQKIVRENEIYFEETNHSLAVGLRKRG